MADLKDILIPDIGDSEGVEVIEVLVSAGATVASEDPLITLESDKASMDVPSPYNGTIKELSVAVGDKVSTGVKIGVMEVDETEEAPPEQAVDTPASTPAAAPSKPAPARSVPAQPPRSSAATTTFSGVVDEAAFRKAHASPAVRKFARELGADLGRITGTGPNSRVLFDDVKLWVKQRLSGHSSAPAALPRVRVVDFARFGEVEVKPLGRIGKISAAHLSACWINIPHVTQFDEADITELESYRKEHNITAREQGYKLTPLAFILKACARTLTELPKCNSSLDESGENIVFKRYINIGVAVDTPDGLIVPVVRAVDKKSVVELARELAEISGRARAGKLTRDDLEGGTFTISSLGGIGGTAFTPIVNGPEVAILGVSRSKLTPAYVDGELVPRLMLPLSLSYDHRVIDGADAARFTTHLSQVLGDTPQLISE